MKTEREWIRAAQAGDREALTALLVPYQRPLLSFLFRMLGDRHEAEDLLQETFVRVLRALGGFRPEEAEAATTGVHADAGADAAADGRCASFARWLFTIAANLARDLRRGRRPHLSLDGRDVEAADAEDAGLAAEGAELKRSLEEAIAALPEAQREVLLLRVYSGLTFNRIAEILECPLNTALGRMHYALTRLRRTLRPLAVEVEAEVDES